MPGSLISRSARNGRIRNADVRTLSICSRARARPSTTPGAYWLNPPLPIDEEGNWYEGAGEDDAEGQTDSYGDDGMTAAERAILEDMDGPRRPSR